HWLTLRTLPMETTDSITAERARNRVARDLLLCMNTSVTQREDTLQELIRWQKETLQRKEEEIAALRQLLLSR
ncbi:hypothetical protein CYMTET_22480, partial [Cymbomonas tetramitiformis]